MALFTADQISLAGVGPDGDVLYVVDLAGSAQRGQVRVSAHRHRAGETES